MAESKVATGRPDCDALWEADRGRSRGTGIPLGLAHLSPGLTFVTTSAHPSGLSLV